MTRNWSRLNPKEAPSSVTAYACEESVAIYQSPQQFNRDYKSLFGISPGKGVKARKSAVLEEPRL